VSFRREGLDFHMLRWRERAPDFRAEQITSEFDSVRSSESDMGHMAALSEAVHHSALLHLQ
jgi:hypothetical protein